jgi:hypothetical protein
MRGGLPSIEVIQRCFLDRTSESHQVGEKALMGCLVLVVIENITRDSNINLKKVGIC